MAFMDTHAMPSASSTLPAQSARLRKAIAWRLTNPSKFIFLFPTIFSGLRLWKYFQKRSGLERICPRGRASTTRYAAEPHNEIIRSEAA